MGKPLKVKEMYLDENGCSELIYREDLKPPLSWTSGDSAFRSDSQLAKEYKFFRFSNTFNPGNNSKCWDFTDDDDKKMRDIHSSLKFKKKGSYVEYIQFFGKLDRIGDDKCIAPWIRKKICSMPCCSCSTKKNIQCDHKDDFKIDTSALDLDTQTLEHFQPLCGSCNTRKREDKKKTIKSGKRQPPPSHIDFDIDFVEGDETFDSNSPNRVGTYWYDCVLFRKKAIEIIIQKAIENHINL